MTVAQDFRDAMRQIKDLNRREGNMDTPFTISHLEFCSKKARTMYQKMLDKFVNDTEIDKMLGVIDEAEAALLEKSAADMQRTIDCCIWY